MPPLYVRFLGYYRVSAGEKYKTRLQNLFLKLRINAYSDGAHGFYIKRQDKIRLCEGAKRERLSLSVNGPFGVGHRLVESRHRIGIPLGVILAVVILVCASRLVWRVEISGNENIASRTITEELSKLGFGVGTKTNAENYDDIIAAYRLSHPEIAWMGIYTKGTTAYVRVIERKTVGEIDEASVQSHLVASCDALIVRLGIEHGTATVKLGSVVKKGDVLALGMISGAHYDTVLRAEGEVIGRVCENVTVEIPYLMTEKSEKKRKIVGFDLIFFENVINILKKTSKTPTDYVIIERKEMLTLPGGLSLPLGCTVREAIYYEEIARSLDKKEAILEGYALLSQKIREAVEEGELLSRKIRVEENEDACVLHATIEYTKNIAESLPFTVN
ncbi:MAG: hypothetical protein E7609_00815 [Ruminococcaceae bacterium]|nr:hypothetical protein [Oscillospiraceae bacterium]